MSAAAVLIHPAAEFAERGHLAGSDRDAVVEGPFVREASDRVFASARFIMRKAKSRQQLVEARPDQAGGRLDHLPNPQVQLLSGLAAVTERHRPALEFSPFDLAIYHHIDITVPRVRGNPAHRRTNGERIALNDLQVARPAYPQQTRHAIDRAVMPGTWKIASTSFWLPGLVLLLT